MRLYAACISYVSTSMMYVVTRPSLCLKYVNMIPSLTTLLILYSSCSMSDNRDSPTSKDTQPASGDGSGGDWGWLDDTQSQAQTCDTEKAKANGLRYGVSDVPPLGLSIVLGFQHYLTMLGATFLSKYASVHVYFFTCHLLIISYTHSLFYY